VLPKLLLKFTLETENLCEDQTAFRTVISEPPYSLLLQIANATAIPSLPNQLGSVIDIDTFLLNPDTRTGFGDAVRTFLDAAHNAEKALFYRLLSQELLASLNPVYAPNERSS